MNSLPEDFSKSMDFSFAPLSPQNSDFTFFAGFPDPLEQFDSVNDPFSNFEQEDYDLAMGPDLSMEPEFIDPSLLVKQYPDPLIGLQNTCYPYPQAILPEPMNLPSSDYAFLGTCFQANENNFDSSSTSQSQDYEDEPDSLHVDDLKHKGIVTRFGEIVNFNPEKVYNALPKTPSSFDKFHYTRHGELDPNITFTANDVQRYLALHPLNARRSSDHGYNGVTLWIQRNPPDSKLRYHNQISARCRFQNCPAVNNLIPQGFYRIALDEHGAKGNDYDPIGSNACCFHLYCFEKFLDFPRICQEHNVQVDTRQLEKEPNGKNRMQLASKGEIDAARAFLKSCKKGIVPYDYPSHTLSNRPYKNTLSDVLAEEMYKHRGNTALGHGRGPPKASHWTVHRGDLELQSQARRITRTALGQTRRTPAERASKPASRRVLREHGETRAETIKQVAQARLRNAECALSVASPQEQSQPTKPVPASKPDGPRQPQPQLSPPQEKRLTSKSLKRAREESSQPVLPPTKPASHPRATRAATGSIRSTRSSAKSVVRQPGERIRQSQRKINYAEASDSDDEQPPIRRSKRRLAQSKDADSEGDSSVGDIIEVKW